MNTCRLGDNICIPSSPLPRVVVIGAGFAGISMIKVLRNQPVQVVVLDKNNFHQFQPLLYQVATSGLDPGNILFEILQKISAGGSISKEEYEERKAVLERDQAS